MTAEQLAEVLRPEVLTRPQMPCLPASSPDPSPGYDHESQQILTADLAALILGILVGYVCNRLHPRRRQPRRSLATSAS
jgi:hypothetical protein